MSKLFTLLIALVTLAAFALEADARRFGGGRTIGKQRETLSQQQAAPKAPAQQQSAAGSTTAPQQQSGASRWLGPLGGLALGAGLAALFLNNGIAGVLAGLALIALVLAAAVYVLHRLRGRTGSGVLQYAGASPDGGQPARIEPVFGGAAPNGEAATARWPADFDAAEFVRHAKLNFVRLQAIHDGKELAAIRDFVTPELYREIAADVAASGGVQKTDVVTLNAEVLEVAIEGRLYVVSVRFSGVIRESESEAPQAFREIWHLEKPVSGRSGWLVAGIQQD